MHSILAADHVLGFRSRKAIPEAHNISDTTSQWATGLAPGPIAQESEPKLLTSTGIAEQVLEPVTGIADGEAMLMTQDAEDVAPNAGTLQLSTPRTPLEGMVKSVFLKPLNLHQNL